MHVSQRLRTLKEDPRGIPVVLSLLILGILSFTVFLRFDHESASTAIPLAETGATIGRPLTLRVPRIEMDISLEDVGLTKTGGMDMPTSAERGGWYELGAKPGEQGNAVIAGHLDTIWGTPAAFWRLSELQPGDTVFVDDEEGTEHAFRVKEVRSYPYDASPLEEIFGASTSVQLNLITCDGDWVEAGDQYAKRLVVYTEAATDI